jgi:hypothetical protein
MADRVRVDPAGLAELATSCETQAAAVRGTSGIPQVGNGFQATGAAVGLVQPIAGGPGTPIGPTLVPPPHSIHHMPIIGQDDPDASWEYEP